VIFQRGRGRRDQRAKEGEIPDEQGPQSIDLTARLLDTRAMGQLRWKSDWQMPIEGWQ